MHKRKRFVQLAIFLLAGFTFVGAKERFSEDLFKALKISKHRSISWWPISRSGGRSR